MTKDKQFKTVEEQISLLRTRHLKFLDESKAKELLKKYNYFDIINGSENILLKSLNPKIYEDVYFEDCFNIYLFDAEIRSLTLKYIFEIEARLKTSIAYNFAKINCSSISDTLNYTERAYYQIPSPTNNYLYQTFMKFDLFRKNTVMPNGTTKLGFIEEKKKDKEYIRNYKNPPFWVTIKDFNFGELYFTYCFFKSDVKEEVLKDFGFSISDDLLFQQILHVLKFARNCCAHIELITRFNLLGIKELNNYKELKNFTGCKHKKLSYFDLLVLLSKFCDTSEILKKISEFDLDMYLHGRNHISNKLLKRMGNIDMNNWKKVNSFN